MRGAIVAPNVCMCAQTTQAFSKVRDVAIIEERIKLGDIEYELLALAYHLGEQSDSGNYVRTLSVVRAMCVCV